MRAKHQGAVALAYPNSSHPAAASLDTGHLAKCLVSIALVVSHSVPMAGAWAVDKESPRKYQIARDFACQNVAALSNVAFPFSAPPSYGVKVASFALQ